MSKEMFDYISENDFESLIEESLPTSLPNNIISTITPWKKSVNMIIFGIALSTFTLNFGYCNYILPTIGIILMLLGFRALRCENKWFKYCFIVSIIRLVDFFAYLILNTTILPHLSSHSLLSAFLTLSLPLLLFILFHKGITDVREKASLPPQTGITALIIWYLILCLLAICNYSGFIIPIAMTICYIFIIRNIYNMSKSLDEAGYAIKTAIIKLNDGILTAIISIILITGFICGYTFLSSYPMEWSARETSEYQRVQIVKSRLIDMGFPLYVLNDISPEDITICENAIEVIVDTKDHPVNDGRPVTTTSFDKGKKTLVRSTVYDKEELRVTGVSVKLPDGKWMIFHHFLYVVDTPFYGTEAIKITPCYQSIPKGWSSAGDITGRILCDVNSRTLVSDYHFLGTKTYTADSPLWVSSTNSDIFASFSMPKGSCNQRGYIAYPIKEAQPGYIISSYFYYTHQNSILQYPVITAAEKMMTGFWNKNGAFITVFDGIQFYPYNE